MTLSYWTLAPWRAHPHARLTREEAVQDGEEARQNEIEALERQIVHVRNRVLDIEVYDPNEVKEEDGDE